MPASRVLCTRRARYAWRRWFGLGLAKTPNPNSNPRPDPAPNPNPNQVRVATWYDAPNGFFPDGEPQRWARNREVWIAYEFWARAKGVATGVIGS